MTMITASGAEAVAAGRQASRLVLACLFGMLSLAAWLPAHADDNVEIRDARLKLEDEVLYLDAVIGYRLTPAMVDALHEGLPLTMLATIEIVRSRDYWVDDVVAHLEQRYRLEFLALTRQYLLTNVNSGAQFRFPSLEAAVSVLGTIVHLPLLDRNLLDPDARYYARMLVQLDEEALPVPLRLLSYFSSDWHLKSEWHSWQLRF